MSDDLRVRLFLEQVEEVEQLLQYKQKAVDEVTKALDDIKGEITDRKRAKVRHAALAAVAVAKAAQLDAEIRLAEEKLCLLEEPEAANPDQKPEPSAKCDDDLKKLKAEEDAKASFNIEKETLAKEKLKLSNEEAKVAKAKELLAAMNFEKQLAKLQEKQRGLEEREAQAEMQHDEACKELQSLLGDVDAANDSGKQGTGEPWPDENILLQPVATLADALKLLQSLGSDEKVRATWDVVRQCQRHLCKPAATPEEDTESVTEPAAQVGGPHAAEAAPASPAPAQLASSDPVDSGENCARDGSGTRGTWDVDKLRDLFAAPEPLLAGTERLKQATEQVESAREAQTDLEAKISEVLAEKQKRSDAIRSMEDEVEKQRITLSELADI